VSNIDKSQPQVASSDRQTNREEFTNFLGLQSSSQRPRSASQAAQAELLTSTLVSAGLDLEKFESLRAQGRTELGEWAEKQKAETDAQTKELQPAIARVVESWRTKVQELQNFAPPAASPFYYDLLDTASQISSTPGVNLTATNIAPTNNWAEFQLFTSDTAIQDVTFTFSWQNTSQKYAVINVDGYLVLNGVVEAIANPGFAALFPGGTSRVGVLPVLFVSGLPWEPPNWPPPIVATGSPSLSLSAQAGWDDPGEILFQPLVRGYDIQYQTQLVPPGTAVTVGVACQLYYNNDNGAANFVFATMGRQVLCPGVLITVVS
jgi:hypothetical protein